MRKVLLSLFLFIPFYSFGFSLPAHFGSSIGIRAKSPKFKDFNKSYDFLKEGWELELQVTSQKFLDGKIQLLTHADVGIDQARAGASIFIKLNKYFYVGGMSTVGQKLDLDHALSATYFLQFKRLYVEPFILFYMKSKKTAGGGVRFYYVNRMALSMGFERHADDMNYFVLFELPLEINLKDLKESFDKVLP